MSSYLAIPTRAGAQYIAIEAAKGAVTGFALGGGTLPVAAAFGLAHTIYCVSTPGFAKLSQYLQTKKQSLAVITITAIQYQGPMLVAAALLKGLGYNQATYSRSAIASVLTAYVFSKIAIYAETITEDPNKKQAAALGFYTLNAFSAAQLLGSDRLLLPLTVFASRFILSTRLNDSTQETDASLSAFKKRVVTLLLPFTVMAGALTVGTKMQDALYSYLKKNPPVINSREEILKRLQDPSRLARVVAVALISLAIVRQF